MRSKTLRLRVKAAKNHANEIRSSHRAQHFCKSQSKMRNTARTAEAASPNRVCETSCTVRIFCMLPNHYTGISVYVCACACKCERIAACSHTHTEN